MEKCKYQTTGLYGTVRCMYDKKCSNQMGLLWQTEGADTICTRTEVIQYQNASPIIQACIAKIERMSNELTECNDAVDGLVSRMVSDGGAKNESSVRHENKRAGGQVR